MSIVEDEFIRALLNADRVALDRVTSADVVFHSPVRSYANRVDVLHLLTLIGVLLVGAEVVRSFTTDGGVATVLESVEDEGVLTAVVQHLYDEAGRVREVSLMLRPVAVMMPTIKRMGALLEVRPLPSAAG